MKRRKFIASSLLTGAAGATFANPLSTTQQATNEIYELKSYEITFGGNRNALISYIKDTLKPALLAEGVKKLMLFSELGNSDPGHTPVTHRLCKL